MSALSLVGSFPVIEIDNKTTTLKQEILDRSAKITKVENKGDYEFAQLGRKEVKGLLKMLEDGRNETLAPVRAFTTKINETVKSFSEALSTEEARVASLMATWAEAEEKKRQEAARAAALEEQRLATLRAEEARKAHEAELARIRAETARKQAEEASSTKARMAARKAENEAMRAQEEALARQEAIRLAEEEKQRQLTVVESKPKGANRKKDYKVVDLMKAFAAQPHLFDVVPSRQKILFHINNIGDVPGLETVSEIKIR